MSQKNNINRFIKAHLLEYILDWTGSNKFIWWIELSQKKEIYNIFLSLNQFVTI